MISILIKNDFNKFMNSKTICALGNLKFNDFIE